MGKGKDKKNTDDGRMRNMKEDSEGWNKMEDAKKSCVA